jgi:hypothetical protein
LAADLTIIVRVYFFYDRFEHTITVGNIPGEVFFQFVHTDVAVTIRIKHLEYILYVLFIEQRLVINGSLHKFEVIDLTVSIRVTHFNYFLDVLLGAVIIIVGLEHLQTS